MEANMKKFFIMLEETWVAVAFAEAGAYEALRMSETRPRFWESVRMHAA
jgi:hypothetical protein